ncbi:MAG: dual specificity protein phosphatase family protein [Lentisphaeria bacterium]|nr:dual specificity protein phosphatase family protein [Lentisphaeria bacterium]
MNQACYLRSRCRVRLAVFGVFLVLGVFFIPGVSPTSADDKVPRVRPANWAAPVIGSDLENFYKVDDKLYRSEQPDDDDFEKIEKLGIKEVLNLRNFHSDDEEAKDTKLKLHHLRMEAGKVTEADVLRALMLIKAAKGPILIHCWHGSDRTGIIAASYRVVFQNWSKENALDEMNNGGYGFHHKIYPNLIQLMNKLDVEACREKLGITVKPAANRETGEVRQP